jgi:AcrR family transcriptional regulator
MSYEVTKSIGKHSYRYQVTSRRDPSTRRVEQTWRYLGRSHSPADDRAADSRARIIAAILQLLDKRDVAHVTVTVIAQTARVSRATFYRHFASKSSALEVTLEKAFSEMRRTTGYRLLDEPITSIDVERARLSTWLESTLRNSVRSAGVLRAAESSAALQRGRSRNSEENHKAVHDVLTHYLARLRSAGIVAPASDEVLADGIQCVISGIFKRVVYDRKVASEAALIKAGVELICSALFSSVRRPPDRGGVHSNVAGPW